MNSKRNKRIYTHKDLQQIASINRRTLQKEYLSIIQLLYSTQIEESTQPIRAYYDMTMIDAAREIELRTMIIKARNNGKVKRKKEQALQAENALLAKLKGK